MRFPNKSYVICILLFLLTFFSRIFLVENYQSHWDGPQYSIAILDYSLKDQTPTTPGYPIYLFIAKILTLFTHDPHDALLLESVVFSALASILIFMFGKMLGGVKAGIVASILYITSPVIYFFGLTAYTYGVDVFFYTFFAYFGYKVAILKRSKEMVSGIALGLLIGLRPQDLIFVWPLALFVLLKLKGSKKIVYISSFLLVCMIWLIPLLVVVGGVGEYLGYLLSGGKTTALGAKITNLFEVKDTLLKGLVLSCGLSFLTLPLFIIVNRGKSLKLLLAKKNRDIVLFFSFWFVPPLFFNLFIRSDHAGYQLPYLMPLLILSSLVLVYLFRKNNHLLFLATLFLCIINLNLFFRDRDPGNIKPYIPTSFHYSEIRKNDLKLGSKILFIEKNIDVNNSLIIIGDSNYIRPVMYHLPNYKIIQVDKLFTKNPNYSGFVRSAFNLKMIEEIKNQNSFTVPLNVKTIVCFDDECAKWFRGSVRVVRLSGNSSMALAKIAGQKMIYDYHFLSMKKL